MVMALMMAMIMMTSLIPNYFYFVFYMHAKFVSSLNGLDLDAIVLYIHGFGMSLWRC